MWTITFLEGPTVLMRAMTDEEIEKARRVVEDNLQRKLPVDPKTDFPTFTIHRDGHEFGGG